MTQARSFGMAAALGVAVGLSGGAEAGLTLTPTGVADGFALSTFATGFESYSTPSGGLGPLGIAFPSTGGVLVSDLNGKVRLFATDTDGQSAASAPVTQDYGFDGSANLTRLNGRTYLVQKAVGEVFLLNNDGTFNRVVASALNKPEGIVGNPVNGHLYVSNGTFGQIYDVNPDAGSSSVILNQGFDGIAISPDGRTLYGSSQADGRVLGYDLVTQALVFQSGPIAGLDGIALGFGNLSGNLFVNTNDGRVVEVNLATHSQTLIATGGSRGDFVSVDPNGSLLLTQSDSVVRLSPPPSGSFSSTPEPATVFLAATAGLLGIIYPRLHKPSGQQDRPSCA